ncbi:helix-turn-helix domain-containing protein [Nostocoides australiense]
MPAPPRPAPRTQVTNWPDTPASDPAVEAVRLLALDVRDATQGRSTRDVAQQCGINHGAIARLLNGESWPDSRTIALLETGLGRSLWPPIGPKGTHTHRT